VVADAQDLQSLAIAPAILGPDAGSVSWPADPLVLRWSAVPYATKYLVWLATDPGLSNLVLGSTSSPQDTQGTAFAFPTTLAPGHYYWAITPTDAEGIRGARSRVASFDWVWPSTTTPREINLATDARVVDPQFSWDPVPGAARYEVEVNAAQDFPAGSKWCCDDPTVGTSLSPLKVLANGYYYWRVRAIDSRGDAGVWNVGTPFIKAFDNETPTVRNLTVRDVYGNAIPGAPTTDTPIVTWDPVPGASRYEVQVAGYQAGLGCDWSILLENQRIATATTAWTPLATAGHIGPDAWPQPQASYSPLHAGNTPYCLRVLARTDDDARSGQVISDWTQLNGLGQPGFTFADPPAPGAPANPFVTPPGAYQLPANGSTTQRTPLFTWNRVAGAGGYYVVVARDLNFTDVVDVGYTDVPAYAPRLNNKAPYADETTAYYWAVIPTTGTGGLGAYSVPAQDSPQAFNESSVPPTPLSPAGGADVPTEPTFRWTSAENARIYRLQIALDPSFANPVQDIKTDSTAFTSSSTLPPDRTLYWRVRGNDWTDQGLNWSPVNTFTRRLPVPPLLQGNPAGGETIPVLSWGSVQGAISYDMHVDQADGTTRDFTMDAPSFTPTLFYGTGIWRWKVRANFPTGAFGPAISGAYSPAQSYIRVISPPAGARGVRSGSRIVISWNPDPGAKQYRVEISTTDAFGTTVASDSTDNTNWAPDIDAATQAKLPLYWRVAALDQGGNTGAFATGVFQPPRRGCVSTKRHRCPGRPRKPRHHR
jgi:hypothetical protein